MVDAEQGGELLDKIRAIRKQMAMELGIVVPPMKLKDNLQLKAGEYVIHLKGIEVGKGELLMGHVLAMSPEGNEKPVDGVPTREPVFNLEAYWVREKDREKYVADGLTIVDHPTIIATHLTEIVRNNAHELLTRRETQKLLDSIAATHQKVVEEITQSQVDMGTVQKVLQNLLREQVSIRDLVTILEAMADACGTIKDPDIITEYVRQRMARSILKPYLVDGVLNIVLFEKSLEEKVVAASRAPTRAGSCARPRLRPEARRKDRGGGEKGDAEEPPARPARPSDHKGEAAEVPRKAHPGDRRYIP